MSNEAAEVKIKLVIDDQAKAAGERLGSELGGVEAKAGEAGESLGVMETIGSVAMGAIAAAAVAGAAAIAGLGYVSHEAFEAALAQSEQVKALAGSILQLSPAASLDEARAAAGLLHEEMEDLGIAAGVSADSINDAFSIIAARSTKPIAEVQHLTEEMANVSKVIPGGLSALSEGFSNIEAGVIRARNPIVQLIAQTDTLHGNAKQVAAELTKMSPEKQMEIAEKAIEKMSARVKDMPLGFNQLMTSLKDIKDNVLETLGGPILDSVTRVMGDIVNFFQAHREQINEVALAIGTRIGEFVDFVSSLFVELMDVFSDEETTVGNGIAEAMEWAADEWDDIKDNAHAIAQTFRDIIDAAAKIVDVAMTIARVSAAVVTGGVSEVVGYGVKAGYNALVGGDSKATTAGGYAYSEEGLDAQKKALHSFEKMNVEAGKLDKAAEKFREVARASGMAEEGINEVVNSLYTAHDRAVAQGGGTAFDDAASQAGIDSVDAAESFKAAWIQAAQQHNVELMKYGASVLEHSELLANELRNSGVLVGDGMQDLGKYIHDSGLKAVFSQKLKDKMSDASAAMKGPSVNFSGGQTFHIKQDFRDQDPDRIALVFRNDILGAAVNRTQSKLGTAFGI